MEIVVMFDLDQHDNYSTAHAICRRMGLTNVAGHSSAGTAVLLPNTTWTGRLTHESVDAFRGRITSEFRAAGLHPKAVAVVQISGGYISAFNAAA